MAHEGCWNAPLCPLQDAKRGQTWICTAYCAVLLFPRARPWDQSGRKEPKALQAVRADRSQEKIRTKFSQCCFNCTVSRNVPEDDDDSAEVPDARAEADGDTAIKGHSGHHKHLKNPTKFLWYFDSIKRQQNRKT